MLNITQNIPKHRKDLRPLRQGIVAPAGYKVVACDSSQIEARVLAYIAGEYELLAQFREGRDPYAELAAKFGYGKNAQEVHDGAKAGDALCKTLRQAAKRLVLSCGYGTGASKLADTLIRDRAMLSQDRAQHRQKARELHQLYRANNQNIVALWARRQKVIEHMVQGGEGWYGGPNNNLFHYGTMPVCGREAVPSIVLPSGFVLRYPNLRMEYNGGTHAEFYYDRPMGKNMVATKTYGGSGVENDTQSLAFQILMYQAVRMSAAGIPLAVNIHDSFAAVVPEAEAESVAQRMIMFMSETPPWVEGLPLAAEAEIADDFTVV